MKAGDLIFGAVGSIAWFALWCADIGAVIAVCAIGVAACMVSRP